MSLLPGTEVAARGLRWEVVFSQAAGEQELLRLRCLEGYLRGEELDLLVPFETVEPIAREMAPERSARLANWRVYHQAFLLEQALGPDALLAAQPGRLRIAPYQLVPVMRALHMSRPRLLLADGVGLGKTIEAGLVLAELIARRRAHRILIVSPAGPLLNQWRDEMRERFGLRFKVLDRASLQEIAYASELGSNPFDHVALGLISIDFAKQERVLQHLERTQYDVVVIDEAHHCTRLGNAGDREDSQRRRLAEVLSSSADCLLLLTATPHDGFDPHFASLIELLDPSLLDGRGALRGDAYLRYVVRRLKRHIKDPETGEDLFKKRRVLPRPVAFGRDSHPRFAAFQEALLALVGPQLRRAIKTRRYDQVLAFISLLKRSVSTAHACRSTIGAIADRLDELSQKGAESQEERRQRLRTLREYRRRLDRLGVLTYEEEQDNAALEARDIAAELEETGAEELLEKLGAAAREARREGDRLRRTRKVAAGLRELAELAGQAAAEDPKLGLLIQEIRTIRAEEPRANVLVYTEYTDSQDVVVEMLEGARDRGELTGEVLALSGKLPVERAHDDDEGVTTRTKVTRRFTEEEDLILVSTDASAEGLNLHARCHHLIHVELPYNPNRLEQRNGRIDRFGQTRDPIVRYLYLCGTFEERLLLRLVAKCERQRARLEFVPNTLGILGADATDTTVKLLEGVASEELELFKRPQRELQFSEADADEDLTSPAYRELLAEVEKAFSSFEKAARTHTWLGDTGLAASEDQLKEADRARAAGKRLGGVSLEGFVLDAVRADSPDPQAVRVRPDGVTELRLGSAWTHGLDEIPGYDPERRVLRLTTQIDLVKDADDQPLGYLGRAHPIVRRALDRVRNVQFGGGESRLDARVSAARHQGSQPALLCTFLGRVQSGAGREIERVLAVMVAKDGAPTLMLTYEDWSSLTELTRATSPAGLWERHFKSWADPRRAEALRIAEVGFEAIAADFTRQHRAHLAAEREALDQWLHARAESLCGPREQAVQVDLFGRGAAATTEAPRWKVLTGDAERLAALATDGGVPARTKSEAAGVLRLYSHRHEALRRREQIEKVEVTPLGLLMLVPESAAGAV